jgi:flagellar biosynthesis/type III secretory pathway protein FliH
MKKFDIVGQLNPFDKPLIDSEFLHTIGTAEKIIQQAQHHAQQIVMQAQQHAQHILNEAQQEGHRVVERQRHEINQMAASEKMTILTDTYAKVEVFLQGIRDTIPVFIENILYRIIGAFDEQQLLARCIAMGIEDLRDATEMYIKVNAQDYDVIQPLLTPWLREGSDGFIRIEKDSFTPAGECTLVSNIGAIELSLEKQLSVFIQGLHQQFGTTPNEEEEMAMAGSYVDNEAFYDQQQETDFNEESSNEEDEDQTEDEDQAETSDDLDTQDDDYDENEEEYGEESEEALEEDPSEDTEDEDDDEEEGE